jgi:hypothetical protein
MKIVVRVELTTDWGDISEQEVHRSERPGHLLRQGNVGLSIGDGKRVLERLQGPCSFRRRTRFVRYIAYAAAAIV